MRRAVLAVARQELGHFGALLQRSTLVALLGLAALAAAAWLAAGPGSLQPDRALYPIGAASDSPWAPVAAGDARFRVVDAELADLSEGRIALWLGSDVLHDARDARSRAAAQAFEQAAHAHLERLLEREPDRAAAFPVRVNVLAVPRLGANAPEATAAAPEGPTPVGGESGDANATAPTLRLVDAVPAAGSQIAVRPSEVQPPFPVRSLVMTFAYLIPMNFVAQMASGTLLAERIRRRGVLVLSAPVPAWTILVGRMLPYAALGLLVLVGAGIATGAGAIGWLAAVPIVLVVLALAIVLGLMARHERELTFLLTGATTMLSVFLFLPAVFTAVPAVANISPVTIIAASIRGEAVGIGAFLYATLPLTAASLALALLGLALYREETLFSQRPLAAKTVQALSARLGSRGALVAAGALAAPFAYALQLLILAFVVPLGLLGAVPIVLVAGGFLKEALKVLLLRAHLAGSAPHAWSGAWVGLGAFLGEKLALLVVVAGFTLSPLGATTEATLGAGTGFFLVAPLFLHVGAGLLDAWGLRRGGAAAWVGWTAASLLHLLYVALLVLVATLEGA